MLFEYHLRAWAALKGVMDGTHPIESLLISQEGNDTKDAILMGLMVFERVSCSLS